jgi:hypothetical protein
MRYYYSRELYFPVVFLFCVVPADGIVSVHIVLTKRMLYSTLQHLEEWRKKIGHIANGWLKKGGAAYSG